MQGDDRERLVVRGHAHADVAARAPAQGLERASLAVGDELIAKAHQVAAVDGVAMVLAGVMLGRVEKRFGPVEVDFGVASAVKGQAGVDAEVVFQVDEHAARLPRGDAQRRVVVQQGVPGDGVGVGRVYFAERRGAVFNRPVGHAADQAGAEGAVHHRGQP